MSQFLLGSVFAEGRGCGPSCGGVDIALGFNLLYTEQTMDVHYFFLSSVSWCYFYCDLYQSTSTQLIGNKNLNSDMNFQWKAAKTL